jgi:cytochrome c553
MNDFFLDNARNRGLLVICSRGCAIGCLFLFSALKTIAVPFTDGELAFFEKRVRPVLVEHCFECHAEKAKGGLRLDSRTRLLVGGDSGAAAVEGDSDASLFIQAIEYGADSNQMPPKKKLSESTIRDLKQWVAMGLPWPDEAENTVEVESNRGFSISDEQRSFWSFQPVSNPAIPSIEGDDWSRTEIDSFIQSALSEKGLMPSSPVNKEQLIRRATFDLIGLPPTAEEIDAFVGDVSEMAFSDVVDRLLASPHYGERWARHWFDGVRYVSDVGYYNFSDLGWRYRDWVIKALNEDMPYDDFVVHQIAGDLLPPPHGAEVYADGIIATGVLAMGNYDDQESDKENLYAEVIDDQIDLVGRQFLGLTLACARCHDHKFDPISAADYYALGGIFMSSQVLEAKSRISAHRLKIPVEPENTMRRYQEARDEINRLQKNLRQSKDKELPVGEVSKIRARVELLKSSLPVDGGMAIGIQEGGYANSRHKEIGDMHLYIRGNPYNLGPVVPRAIPVLFSGRAQTPLIKNTSQSGRLELARWIADEDNPLTARVMVNRLWQHHFGKGLVATSNNFGFRGEKPSHPKLLNYLASSFTRSGWSIKAMHRLIMNSAVYQQSTQGSERLTEVDPENRLLGRFPSRRLSAEEVNDSLLAVSRRMKAEIGMGNGNRAIYNRVGHLYSSLVMNLFDSPATGTIAASRSESTTAPQALFMMNDEAVIVASRNMAQYLDTEAGSYSVQIERAYQILYGRRPNESEILAGRTYLSEVESDRRWTYFQVLICSNEFIYVD